MTTTLRAFAPSRPCRRSGRRSRPEGAGRRRVSEVNDCRKCANYTASPVRRGTVFGQPPPHHRSPRCIGSYQAWVMVGCLVGRRISPLTPRIRMLCRCIRRRASEFTLADRSLGSRPHPAASCCVPVGHRGGRRQRDALRRRDGGRSRRAVRLGSRPEPGRCVRLTRDYLVCRPPGEGGRGGGASIIWLTSVGTFGSHC